MADSNWLRSALFLACSCRHVGLPCPFPSWDKIPILSFVQFLMTRWESCSTPDPVSALASARCVHLHGSHPSSPRTGQSSCGTRHLPTALPDPEFGDPELGPLCMRDILRKATFSGFFENLRKQVLTQGM